MTEKQTHPLTCYAFRETTGRLDVDSIAETPGAVRERMLEDAMGWRYGYPDRYSHDEIWQRFLQTGEVVKVSVAQC